jgi:alcohol dehydrogenase
MMQGSFLAGMAIQNAGVGAVHALAHTIGVRYNQPHGLVCGVLLPHIMAFNLPLVEEKYGALAVAAGVVPGGTESGVAAARFVEYVRRLVAKLGLPAGIRELGVTEEDIDGLVEATLPANSLKTNPRRVTRQELKEILREAL